MKNLFFLCFFLCSFVEIFAQRNVILIIADDLGTDYCGFYENHLDTAAMPNVRKLLARGVRFRNAWSNPVCSPTRSGMLTGRYSFRTGVGTAVGAANSAVLDTSEITIPRLLNRFKPNGIAKANIGKWHLQLSTPKSNYTFPNIMGYDHYEGNFLGTLNSYTNWTKITNGVESTITNYATTETVNNAISWLNNNQNKPFFLWLAFNAPHTPYHLPPAGLHTYTNLSGTPRDISDNPKSYYKASLEALDHEIGRLFDALKTMQQWDNTDIIFIGDNGNEAAVSQYTGSAKGSIYQAGVSVPFIISGSSIVNPNRASDALVNTQDLFATILELFGHTTWQSQIPANKPIDSKSLLPILKNQATDVRNWAFTEVFKMPTVAGDGKAMRNKDYKLMLFDNGTKKFFNLSKDPTEKTDLMTNMSTVDITNYNFLCTEMANLVGKSTFCENILATETDKDFAVNQAFPNPFTTTIFMKINSQTADYTLSNALGQILFFGKNIENQNFAALPQGIYFLQVFDKTTQNFKLIKE